MFSLYIVTTVPDCTYMCQVGLFILPKWMFLWNTRKLDYLKLSCLYIPSYEFVVNNVYCIVFAINYNPIWFKEFCCVHYEAIWLKLKRQASCLLYFYKHKRYLLVSEKKLQEYCCLSLGLILILFQIEKRKSLHNEYYLLGYNFLYLFEMKINVKRKQRKLCFRFVISIK